MTLPFLFVALLSISERGSVSVVGERPVTQLGMHRVTQTHTLDNIKLIFFFDGKAEFFLLQPPWWGV